MSYGYNATTAFSTSISNLNEEAVLLLDAIDSSRGTSDSGRPIIFIAHSLGGIVVKKVLSELFTVLFE
jgi:hypothetical protein